MNSISILLNAIVEFPDNPGGWFPWIGKLCYGIIDWIHNNGAIGYGVAIILFSIILKLILSPLDFLTKYFTKKNAKFMQRIKPEEDALKEQYAGEMQKFMLARQQLYRKHGYKAGGFMLFMLLNLFITMAVFFSVFSALRNAADYNIKMTAVDLQATYAEFYNAETNELLDGKTAEEFVVAVNETYESRMNGFLWIQNIWKQDIPTSSRLTEGEYTASVLTKDERNNADLVANAKIQYENIINNVEKSNKRSWNGLLILIILAGVTSWASAWLNAKMMAAKKAKEAPKQKEAVVTYSMRETKNQRDAQIPTVDPVAMGRIMKIILPAMMVLFTFMSTSALALYIITNSIMSTALTYATNWPVDKILERQEKKRIERGESDEVDPNIINPHSKYFKNKRK